MGRKLIIYPDTCFYGRPFDRPPTPEKQAEAAAVNAILKRRERGELRIIGSAIVSYEIGQIPNAIDRKIIDAYYCKFITETVTSTGQDYIRADILAATAGLGVLDSQHLAMAESAGAGFLLTVDVKFIRRCSNRNLTTVMVMNPLDFLSGGFI